MLKLEAGKRYWRRDGGVSAILHHETGSVASMRFHDGLLSWCENGEYFTNKELSPYDLVREYTEPQPLEWKRGIPTEEECRECCIISGGFGLTPNAFDKCDVYPAAETTADEWGINEWYLPLRINPVEPPKPKTRTVTLCKLTHKNGGELWWPENAVFATFYEWQKTGETRTVEVPRE